MSTDIVCSVEEIAALVPSAAKLAIVKEPSGMALAATLAIARRGVRDLHLVCVPVGGLAADILIGAGCVATIETSAVSLGEFGAAPRFTHAVRTGDIKILDATCPAIYAALQAAEKGVPFLPLRGLIGSDVLAHRVDWKVIDNPFLPGDKIAVVAAIRPDIALFHVSLADRFGNVFIGRDRELMLMAHASQATLVTAECIVEEDLLENAAMAGAVIPALYVSRLALAPRGAWPLALADRYPEDERALADYATEAKTVEGFQRVIASWSDGVPEGELSAA